MARDVRAALTRRAITGRPPGIAGERGIAARRTISTPRICTRTWRRPIKSSTILAPPSVQPNIMARPAAVVSNLAAMTPALTPRRQTNPKRKRRKTGATPRRKCAPPRKQTAEKEAQVSWRGDQELQGAQWAAVVDHVHGAVGEKADF